MKESGIDWIGQIPEEWGISKIKFTTQLNGRIGWQGLTSAEYKEEGPYLITGTDFHNGTINFETAVHIDEKRWSEASQIQVENGDLLITKDGTVGKVAIISGLDDKASLNSGVLRIQTIDEIDRRFLYYVLLSDEFWMWFNYTNSGASTILHLYQNVFDEFTFTFPQKNEQQKIADFLDKKTAQLDKVKSLLEEQIQKLKDYRASLIYETVTKGLDKSVPMKDSGIDWIGQVPEGWGVKPLKYLASYDDETLTQSEINSNQKINYVDIGAVEFTKGINGYQELLMSDAPSRARKIAKKGDTIISTVRTYLKAIAYLNDDYIVSTGFCVVRPKKVNSKYLNYTIMSDSFTGPVSKYAWGVSYPAISSSQLVNIPIPFPESIEKQLSIVDYLDYKMLQINQLIDIKQEQIENINKQRQTLIYDYVTGKRRV
jgi:restriction endonuclease, S subunit